MSNNDQELPTEGDALLAAEYALGVLDAAARSDAERRIASDPAFADEVAFWDARLSGLARAIPSVSPPERVWNGIDARVDAMPEARASLAAANEPDLARRLSFWRLFGLGAAGLAAASIAALIVLVPAAKEPPVAARNQPLFAKLAAAGSNASFIASVSPDRTVLVVPTSLTVNDRQVPELWIIPADGTPRSLGVIDPSRPQRVAIPDRLNASVADNATLAVSLEPRGGSPTGKPTGPVIAAGKLAAL